MMRFSHSERIWQAFPGLHAAAIGAGSIVREVEVGSLIEGLEARARSRLGSGTESELAEIQAWRRTFSQMGLKPTQYRCAAESLLRRFRKENSLPRLHPLVDLCNAASLAYAVPIAVFDTAYVTGDLEVRHAMGEERYLEFSGAVEHPEPEEIIFADAAGNAHARRWCHRQSGLSAVRDATGEVLIVAEAQHESAAQDIERLAAELAGALTGIWRAAPRIKLLTAADPIFEQR